MKKFRKRWVVLIAAIALALPAAAQKRNPDAAPPGRASTVQPESASVEREIDDPNSGVRWLLVENPAHPGGPGRLVLSGERYAEAQSRRARAQGGEANPVIHAGEAVQVEEHSAVADASLQAVALETAAPGDILRVRLRIGGRVLKARALGPGRAALSPVGGKP